MTLVILMRGNAPPNEDYKSHLVYTIWNFERLECGKMWKNSAETLQNQVFLIFTGNLGMYTQWPFGGGKTFYHAQM